jgi:hypothetical protein
MKRIPARLFLCASQVWPGRRFPLSAMSVAAGLAAAPHMGGLRGPPGGMPQRGGFGEAADSGEAARDYVPTVSRGGLARQAAPSARPPPAHGRRFRPVQAPAQPHGRRSTRSGPVRQVRATAAHARAAPPPPPPAAPWPVGTGTMGAGDTGRCCLRERPTSGPAGHAVASPWPGRSSTCGQTCYQPMMMGRLVCTSFPARSALGPARRADCRRRGVKRCFAPRFRRTGA